MRGWSVLVWLKYSRFGLDWFRQLVGAGWAGGGGGQARRCTAPHNCSHTRQITPSTDPFATGPSRRPSLPTARPLPAGEGSAAGGGGPGGEEAGGDAPPHLAHACPRCLAARPHHVDHQVGQQEEAGGDVEAQHRDHRLEHRQLVACRAGVGGGWGRGGVREAAQARPAVVRLVERAAPGRDR